MKSSVIIFLTLLNLIYMSVGLYCYYYSQYYHFLLVKQVKEQPKSGLEVVALPPPSSPPPLDAALKNSTPSSFSKSVEGWLPAGLSIKERRASQQENLMAHELFIRHSNERNLTTKEWCPMILKQYAPENKGSAHLWESKPAPEMIFKGVRETDLSGKIYRAPLKRFMPSQFLQDWALFSAIFSNEADMEDKVYIDLAAAYPSEISNTFFFDACLGWSGVCIEADPTKTPDLLSARGCVLVDTCIWDTPGKVMFMAPDKNAGDTKVHGVPNPGKHHEALECVTMNEVFTATAITHVDLMSLDCEGCEAHALQGLNFSAVRIEMIILEIRHVLSVDSFAWNGNAKIVATILKENSYIPLIAFPGLCKTGIFRTFDDVFLNKTRSMKTDHHDVIFILKDSKYLQRAATWFAELESVPGFANCAQMRELVV